MHVAPTVTIAGDVAGVGIAKTSVGWCRWSKQHPTVMGDSFRDGRLLPGLRPLAIPSEDGHEIPDGSHFGFPFEFSEPSDVIQEDPLLHRVESRFRVPDPQRLGAADEASPAAERSNRGVTEQSQHSALGLDKGEFAGDYILGRGHVAILTDAKPCAEDEDRGQYGT
jgi:hypothetical protein